MEAIRSSSGSAIQFRFAVDGWMVAAFVGIAGVAHYAIASRLSGYFLTFILSALGLLQSWFSQLFGGENFKGIRRTLRLASEDRCRAIDRRRRLILSIWARFSR